MTEEFSAPDVPDGGGETGSPGTATPAETSPAEGNPESTPAESTPKQSVYNVPYKGEIYSLNDAQRDALLQLGIDKYYSDQDAKDAEPATAEQTPAVDANPMESELQQLKDSYKTISEKLESQEQSILRKELLSEASTAMKAVPSFEAFRTDPTQKESYDFLTGMVMHMKGHNPSMDLASAAKKVGAMFDFAAKSGKNDFVSQKLAAAGRRTETSGAAPSTGTRKLSRESLRNGEAAQVAAEIFANADLA